MKTIVLKVRNLPNNVDTDLFVYCMQQDVSVAYPRGKIELVPDIEREVVRCKDCVFRDDRDGMCEHVQQARDPDWYCADGERRFDYMANKKQPELFSGC